ncbi:MAG: UDP-N-acetylmuramate dehydrogenase [Minisyncoccia bacterium]
MNIQEHISLAPFTTFRIGGPARVFVEAHSEEDIQAAIALARDRGLPLYALGAGSNVLVPDAGVEGVVLRVCVDGLLFEDAGDSELLVGGAGTPWEEVVDAVALRGVFGIENLAGIPGTLGGAAVQNIGAYGVELSSVFAYADVVDSKTGDARRVDAREAAFAYRTSLFKEHRTLIIVRVALRLAKKGQLNTAYADLARVQAEGTFLATLVDVVREVRVIRAAKFPSLLEEGTAGSFFKNPIIPNEQALELAQRFPGLPVFPQKDGTAKVSLAWLLDHALSLKGYASGNVRLYEKQPLVMVARDGATGAEVDAFAMYVSERVFAETGIVIEREVETFGMR